MRDSLRRCGASLRRRERFSSYQRGGRGPPCKVCRSGRCDPLCLCQFHEPGTRRCPVSQQAAEDYPEPSEFYAASKWQAEQSLTELFANTACLLTIIRPGLVYDAELTANLKTMERLLRWWPLLFPAIGRRSMLARADLADLLVSCAQGDAGAPMGEKIIAATDGECYDAQRISRALSVTAKWGVMPRWLCRMGCVVLDCVRGYPAGASWQGLSASNWYGPTPAISGWQPRRALESRSANERPASR